jgi:hypothetical protein
MSYPVVRPVVYGPMVYKSEVSKVINLTSAGRASVFIWPKSIYTVSNVTSPGQTISLNYTLTKPSSTASSVITRQGTVEILVNGINNKITDTNTSITDINFVDIVKATPTSLLTDDFIINKIKTNKTNEEDKTNDCIIRFALFIGHVKYIENHPNDPIDESEIKKERLLDSKLDQTIEKLTMRISDHDGVWANGYDTAYIGNIELDNGASLPNTPFIVTKIYEQQTSLSYHYVHKKIFPEQFEIL